MNNTKHRCLRGFPVESEAWDAIRDHAPVRADGATPFMSRQEFDDVGYWAPTVGIRHRF